MANPAGSATCISTMKVEPFSSVARTSMMEDFSPAMRGSWKGLSKVTSFTRFWPSKPNTALRNEIKMIFLFSLPNILRNATSFFTSTNFILSVRSLYKDKKIRVVRQVGRIVEWLKWAIFNYWGQTVPYTAWPAFNGHDRLYFVSCCINFFFVIFGWNYIFVSIVFI